MKSHRIKCFIAMPFGKKDCDFLYKNQIRPLLKDLHIDPIRVDQRQHKEDLNVYIIKMLEESDMALADLTYARPSVYYEAGYADRKIPVVYTSRTDHLSRKQKDDSLRIHFDLEMKKIVSWSTPSDPSFSARLKKRVSYFAAPIKRALKENSRIDKDRADFTSKSIIERIAKVEQYASALLRQKRFSVIPLRDLERRIGQLFSPAKVLIATKLIGDTCHLCIAIISHTITAKQIKIAMDHLSFGRFFWKAECSDYIERYYFCTLQSLPEFRLRSSLPALSRSDSPGCFSMPYKAYFDTKEDCIKKLFLISPIDSISSMKEGFVKQFAALPSQKTNLHTYFIRDQGYSTSGSGRISFKSKPAPIAGAAGPSSK